MDRLFVLFTLVLLSQSAFGATFTINSLVDGVDSAPGNGTCATAGGTCTLRAAVQEANALAGTDTINLMSGTHTLSFVGTGENVAMNGDLDITSNLTIRGVAGPGTASVVDANSSVTGERGIHVASSSAIVSLLKFRIKNGSDSWGGGIYSDGTTTLSNMNVMLNTASSFGGGVYCDSGSSLTVTGSTIAGNDGGSSGGGLYCLQLTMSRSIVDGNIADEGGGITTSTATLLATTVSDNEATAFWGGGIQYHDLTVTDSAITNNIAAIDGGGLFAGGGASALRINNSTVSGNQADNGAGISIGGASSTATINSSTIAYNISSGYGGGMVVGGGGSSADVTNSIIAQNTAVTWAADCSGTVVSSGYNFIGDIDSCTYTSDTGDQTGDSTGAGIIDPSLSVLANNGGLTQTHAFSSTSLVVDAGDPVGCQNTSGVNLTYDQRGPGYPRVKDGDSSGTATCDIGAYEL